MQATTGGAVICRTVCVGGRAHDGFGSSTAPHRRGTACTAECDVGRFFAPQFPCDRPIPRPSSSPVQDRIPAAAVRRCCCSGGRHPAVRGFQGHDISSGCREPADFLPMVVDARRAAVHGDGRRVRSGGGRQQVRCRQWPGFHACPVDGPGRHRVGGHRQPRGDARTRTDAPRLHLLCVFCAPCSTSTSTWATSATCTTSTTSATCASTAAGYGTIVDGPASHPSGQHRRIRTRQRRHPKLGDGVPVPTPTG